MTAHPSNMIEDTKYILQYMWAACQVEHPDVIKGDVAMPMLDGDIVDWSHKMVDTYIEPIIPYPEGSTPRP